MLISLVPTSFHHFSSVGLVFLFRCVMKEPHIVMDIKVEEGTGFPSGLVNDEIVKGVMLETL